MITELEEKLVRETQAKDARIKELEADGGALRSALDWLVHVAHGAGRAGGSPEPDEFEDALEAGERALAGKGRPMCERAEAIWVGVYAAKVAALSSEVGTKDGTQQRASAQWRHQLATEAADSAVRGFERALAGKGDKRG